MGNYIFLYIKRQLTWNENNLVICLMKFRCEFLLYIGEALTALSWTMILGALYVRNVIQVSNIYVVMQLCYSINSRGLSKLTDQTDKISTRRTAIRMTLPVLTGLGYRKGRAAISIEDTSVPVITACWSSLDEVKGILACQRRGTYMDGNDTVTPCC